MDNYDNPWLWNGEPLLEIPKGIEAFVYEIVDLHNNRKYIGRKYFFIRRKPKTGGRRKKIEGPWRKYYSSNEFIKTEAKTNPHRFRREIIHLCETESKANYLEVAEQFKRDVLCSENYYNHHIASRWYKKNVKNYFS